MNNSMQNIKLNGFKNTTTGAPQGDSLLSANRLMTAGPQTDTRGGYVPVAPPREAIRSLQEVVLT